MGSSSLPSPSSSPPPILPQFSSQLFPLHTSINPFFTETLPRVDEPVEAATMKAEEAAVVGEAMAAARAMVKAVEGKEPAKVDGTVETSVKVANGKMKEEEKE